MGKFYGDDDILVFGINIFIYNFGSKLLSNEFQDMCIFYIFSTSNTKTNFLNFG